MAKTSKYQLLVLMDKSEASSNALKNAINLAKLIDGSIEVFQVKKLNSEVKFENQFSAMTALNKEHLKEKEALTAMVNATAEKEGLSMRSNFIYGNAKNEIKAHIKKTNPDIIIVGKRKKKNVSFLGDGLTKSLLKYHNGPVLISGDDEAFASYNNKSIGFLNNVEGIETMALVNDLKQHTQEPLKLFKMNNASMNASNQVQNTTQVHEINASDNSPSGMASLISDNNLTLLCINNNNGGSNTAPLDKIYTQTIEQTQVPVLILNNN